MERDRDTHTERQRVKSEMRKQADSKEYSVKVTERH